jgi:hypothetical protein
MNIAEVAAAKVVQLMNVDNVVGAASHDVTDLQGRDSPMFKKYS